MPGSGSEDSSSSESDSLDSLAVTAGLGTSFGAGFEGASSESSSEDSSLESWLELDSGLAAVFAGEAFAGVDLIEAGFVGRGACAPAFVGTSLVDASSEDSSDDDSSLDSSLEPNSAAAVTFAEEAFAGSAFAGAGPDFADFAVGAPLIADLRGTALVGAGLAAGFGGSSSESSPSESSSLSLSLDSEDESPRTGGLKVTVFAGEVLVAGSSSESLSLDSDGEPALKGGGLDCHRRVNPVVAINILRYALSRLLVEDAWPQVSHLQKKIPLTRHWLHPSSWSF